MKLSAFGEKFAADSGISALMEDLGTALNDDPSLLFMGGGNPGHIEAVQAVVARAMRALLDDRERRQQVLGVYQAPQGDRSCRVDLAAWLRRHCGWDLGPENIAIANGSQSAFFVLANLFAGPDARGGAGTVHLPLSPEYVGYRNAGLTESFFTAARPQIELRDGGMFKYHLDPAQQLPPGTSAVCLSRPCNPTGNVIGDEELARIDAQARAANVPLMLDSAYGLPFPGLSYTGATPHWNDNTILLLSMSKLGLPGVRTGIVIARPEIARAFARANTVLSLASGTLGPALLRELVVSGELETLCSSVIHPYYLERRQLALDTLRHGLAGLPVRIHEPDGAFFLWLWCDGLPMGSEVLYRRLKSRGVIVLPGQEFFIGLDDDWAHRHECLRLSYAGDSTTVSAGCALVADELQRIYAGDPT
jgi:valine--pyruvate aminotransferase